MFRTANALEQRLDVPVTKARAAAAAAGADGAAANGNGACGLVSLMPPAVSDVVGSYGRWDLMGPLKTGLMQVKVVVVYGSDREMGHGGEADAR